MDPQPPPAYQPPASYPPFPPQGQPGASSNLGQPYTPPPMPAAAYQPTASYSAPPPIPAAPYQPAASYSPPPTPANIPPVATSQVMSVAQQIAQQINSANNVLVTVSNDPSVDQLSAAIGMTLILNKLGKHSTAVFSGVIPPAIEFLQPEKTLEKNTDSLRDFIIALDKAKADKLRYKIEDKYVKIFITPYRTKIDEKDLQFTQGELNVDVVIALGVKTRDELDQAITAHGQILHDATIISINHQSGANLGSVNWNETRTSSLSELVAKLADALQPGQTKKLLDKQVATALLTGAVAETDRFSNSKTTPETMNMAAKLMDAGANQPLISSKLDKIKPIAALLPKKPTPALPNAPASTQAATTKADEPAKPAEPPTSIIDSDGSLHISHDDGVSDDEDEEDSDIEKIHIDEFGVLQKVDKSKPKEPKTSKAPKPIAEAAPVPTPDTSTAPPVAAASTDTNDSLIDGIADETLSDIEQAVHSPHLKNAPAPNTQPPPGPGTGSSGFLGPDPSAPSIMNVKPSGGLEAPGSGNVNDPSNSEGPLFSPTPSQSFIVPGQASDPLSPPPVPPPMNAGSPPSNNLSDPNSGVPL